MYVDRATFQDALYMYHGEELKRYEKLKNKKEAILLEKPHKLKENELQKLALKTILEETSNTDEFENLDNEEQFFRTDLYFHLHEKGFNYCNKVFMKNDLRNDKNEFKTLI